MLLLNRILELSFLPQTAALSHVLSVDIREPHLNSGDQGTRFQEYSSKEIGKEKKSRKLLITNGKSEVYMTNLKLVT